MMICLLPLLTDLFKQCQLLVNVVVIVCDVSMPVTKDKQDTVVLCVKVAHEVDGEGNIRTREVVVRAPLCIRDS